MKKFNKLFNKIILEQQQSDEDQLDKIIYFSESITGKNIIKKLKRSLSQTLLEYKQKFPEFKNIKLAYDMINFEENDVYAEVFPEDLDTIHINLFPFLQTCYYGQFNQNFSFENMLNQIKNGTYQNMNGPLIAHQLAHILDIKNNCLSEINVHNETFNKYLNDLK